MLRRFDFVQFFLDDQIRHGKCSGIRMRARLSLSSFEP